MWRTLSKWLFGDQPASFRSDFPLSVSIARLKASVKPHQFASLFRECATGPVSQHNVRLERVRPMFHNGFKPFFYGAFEDIGGEVVLRGRFTMAFTAKIFMTIWFGFGALLILASSIFVVAPIVIGPGPIIERVAAMGFPLFGLTLLGMGCALVKFGWWCSKNDIQFLSRTIERALEK